jgi:hypothetical protein
MTILLVSVVYWFWTQNQYIQRKLNLLENIVYEMKTTLHASIPDELKIPTSSSVPPSPKTIQQQEQSFYAPPPGSELGEDEDLVFEQLMHSEDVEVPLMDNENAQAPMPFEESVADDLQPGGIGSGIKDIAVPDMNHNSVLENMTLKELKRLAEQKGIQGVKHLRKTELIEALRNHTVNLTPFEVSEATLELN